MGSELGPHAELGEVAVTAKGLTPSQAGQGSKRLCLLLALGPQASLLPSLSLGFLLCRALDPVQTPPHIPVLNKPDAPECPAHARPPEKSESSALKVPAVQWEHGDGGMPCDAAAALEAGAARARRGLLT